MASQKRVTKPVSKEIQSVIKFSAPKFNINDIVEVKFTDKSKVGGIFHFSNL